MISLFKRGVETGISTDATTEKQFLAEVSALLNKMVEVGMFLGDWEFQLAQWLPQIVDVATALRGSAVLAGPVSRVLVCGLTHHHDLVGFFSAGEFDFPKEGGHG